MSPAGPSPAEGARFHPFLADAQDIALHFVKQGIHLPLVLVNLAHHAGKPLLDVVACDAVRLRLSQFGGITPIRRARDLAAAWGLAMTLEDSGGGDVVTAAMAHLSCSVPPRLLLNGFLVGEMVNERIAAGAPRAVDGRARLPAGPGLGVEVNEEALGEPVLRVE